MHIGEVDIKGIKLDRNDKFLSPNKHGRLDEYIILSIETAWIPLNKKNLSGGGALGLQVTIQKTEVWDKSGSGAHWIERRTPEQVAKLIDKGTWVRCIKI